MAIDPQQLATEQTQRSAMDAAGSPTEFAEGPEQEFEVAGLGNLLRLLAKQPNQVTVPDVAPDPDAATPPVVQGGGRVPTPAEKVLLPQDGTGSYVETQKRVAPQVLSPPALEEFQRRGFSAFPDKSDELISDAQKALDEDAAQREEARILAQEANRKAQRALTADANKMSPNAGLADEEKSDRILQKISAHEKNIKSLKDGGDFNFERINGYDDLYAALTAVGDEYKVEQVARTRGRISKEQTMEEAANLLADEIGFSRMLLKRNINSGGLNAAQFVAGRELLTRSATKLINLAETIKAGEGSELTRLQFRRQLAIHAGVQLQLKGAQTETARALNSFNYMVGGEEMANASTAAVMRLLDEGGGAELTDDMVDKFLDVAAESGQGGINAFSAKGFLAKTKRAIHEAYLVGLLWNASTQVKNIVGTGSFMLYQIPAEIAAGAYGSVLRRIQNTAGFEISPEQVYMEDALLRIKGWQDGFRDAWRAGSTAFKTELPGKRASKLDVEEYAAISANPNTAMGRAINQIGRTLRIPFRTLLAADEFFKVISQRGELYTRVNQRYQQVLREGRSLEEAEAEAGMLLLDPNAIADQLDTIANYDTMQTRLKGVSEAASYLQSFWLGRFILPFATAPTNSMLKLAEFSPIGAGRAVLNIENMTPKQRQLMLGRASLGTYTMYQFAQYAAEGKITGAYPENRKDWDTLPPGWQPYSFVVRGDDWPVDENGDQLPLYDYLGYPNGNLKYISYSGFEPVGAIIGVGANLFQNISMIPGDKQGAEYAASAVLAGLSTTIDYYKELPMLQGLADIFEAMETDRITALTRSYAENASVFGIVPNPFSAIQRVGADLYDPAGTRPRNDKEYYTEADILSGVDAVYDADGKLVTPFQYFHAKKGTNKPNYNLIGTPKNSAAASALQTFQSYMQKDSLFISERDMNAVVYDVLGHEKKRSTISVYERPVAAIRNRVLGVRIEEGREPTDLERELHRLNIMTGSSPLNNRSEIKGISLGFGDESDLTNFIKNEHRTYITGIGAVPFRRALEIRIKSTAYQGLSDLAKKKSLSNIQNEFYATGIDKFLANPKLGSDNMKQAIKDLAEAKAQGRVQ